jgi:Ser/Thr protein kinase RdoA (MazF antagonist)
MKTAADLFLGLTPDAVLAAIEASGLRCTSVCWPLNSYENRVMEVELADAERTRLVAKFYRPQRWTQAQILEEHAFLAELHAAEVPVVPALAFPDGGTLRQIAVPGGADVVWFCLFPRFGGRAPEEVDDQMAARLGALCARIHVVGARQPFLARLRLNGATFGTAPLALLDASGRIPGPLRRRFLTAANALGVVTDEWLNDTPTQRIHGDFHLGNLILRDNILHALDFDDALTGPPVQDLWMLLPGRDVDTLRRRELFLQSYEQFRPFDRTSLRLIEPLRGLRLVHFCAWLAARWHDAIFPQTWPQFATDAFWHETTDALEEALDLAWTPTESVAVAPQVEATEVTNADFFWDWQK